LETIVQYLWVRVGDADDYHNYDDLAEAAEYVTQFGVGHVWRKFKYGVDAEDLRATTTSHFSTAMKKLSQQMMYLPAKLSASTVR
jgi:hypothetical protein